MHAISVMGFRRRLLRQRRHLTLSTPFRLTLRLMIHQALDLRQHGLDAHRHPIIVDVALAVRALAALHGG